MGSDSLLGSPSIRAISLHSLRAIAILRESKVLSERSESKGILMYHFYILRCSDNSLYCSMTSNLDKRLREHNPKGSKGAKYLRAKKPVILVYSENYPDIKTAMNRELQVKKWTKAKKEALIKGD